MNNKFAGRYLLYVKKEVINNELVRDLGSEVSKLGEFIINKTILRIYATKLFKSEYNSPNKAEIKLIIDNSINKIKESPIPPESENWKTFKSFNNNRKYKFRVAGLNIEGTDDQLIYLYVQYGSKFDNAEHNIVHVILTDCGNPETFNLQRADISLLKSKIDEDNMANKERFKKKYNEDKDEERDKAFSSKYKRPEWVRKALIEHGHNPDDFEDARILLDELEEDLDDKEEEIDLRTFSEKDQKEYLKKTYVNPEDLIIDKNGKVCFNAEAKKRLRKVCIKGGHDLDKLYPARWDCMYD
jgi:hypothetical protein